MSYILNKISIRTNNSKEGIRSIEEIWRDISTGKLPILFDNEGNFKEGISPVSVYSNYESDENGNYDLSIIGVNSDFFKEMEDKVKQGLYKLYDEKDEEGNLSRCSKKAWEKVWNDTKSGKIKRKFTQDYESTVPKQYTADKKAHCYLYIALK